MKNNQNQDLDDWDSNYSHSEVPRPGVLIPPIRNLNIPNSLLEEEIIQPKKKQEDMAELQDQLMEANIKSAEKPRAPFSEVSVSEIMSSANKEVMKVKTGYSPEDARWSRHARMKLGQSGAPIPFGSKFGENNKKLSKEQSKLKIIPQGAFNQANMSFKRKKSEQLSMDEVNLDEDEESSLLKKRRKESSDDNF